MYTHFTFTLMAHCTSGAIRGSVSCSRTLRQGIELIDLLITKRLLYLLYHCRPPYTHARSRTLTHLLTHLHLHTYTHNTDSHLGSQEPTSGEPFFYFLLFIWLQNFHQNVDRC